jgi:hypothetical protein
MTFVMPGLKSKSKGNFKPATERSKNPAANYALRSYAGIGDAPPPVADKRVASVRA